MAPGIPWLGAALPPSLPPSLHKLLLLPVLLLCVSLTRTLDIGFSTHLDNLGPSHLEILNSIPIVKAFSPNKVIFIGSGGYDVATPFEGPPFDRLYALV